MRSVADHAILTHTTMVWSSLSHRGDHFQPFLRLEFSGKNPLWSINVFLLRTTHANFVTFNTIKIVLNGHSEFWWLVCLFLETLVKLKAKEICWNTSWFMCWPWIFQKKYKAKMTGWHFSQTLQNCAVFFQIEHCN